MPNIYKIVDAMYETGIPKAAMLAVLETLRNYLTPAEIASFQWRMENPIK